MKEEEEEEKHISASLTFLDYIASAPILLCMQNAVYEKAA